MYSSIHICVLHFIHMTDEPTHLSVGKLDFTRSTDVSNKRQKHKPKFESIIECLKKRG